MENQRNITVQIPVVSQRTMIPVLFGAAALFFFFTFCEISCGNQRLAAMTGIEMMTGTEIKGGEMFGKEFEEMVKSKAGSMGKEDGLYDDETESDTQPIDTDEPGNKSIPSNIWAILAFVEALVGLGIYLMRNKVQGLIGGIAGVSGAIFLLIMQIQLTNAVKEQGGGFAMIEAKFTLAFWGSLLALLVAGVLSFLRMRATRAEDEFAPPPIDFFTPSGKADNLTDEQQP